MIAGNRSGIVKFGSDSSDIADRRDCAKFWADVCRQGKRESKEVRRSSDGAITLPRVPLLTFERWTAESTKSN